MKIKPLWPHQKASIKFGAACFKRGDPMLDLSDPGTAKTRVQLELFKDRRKKRGGRALVLCPKTLMQTAWGNDIDKFTPELTYTCCYADKRDKYFQQDSDIYVTNIDAVVWLLKQKPGFFRLFDTLVIDEFTKFKHHTSARSRALGKIKKHFKYRAGLSGTPNSNTICDIWHPMSILDDGRRLGGSFFAFRSTVCTPVQVGRAAQMVKWEDKPGAEEAVFGSLADVTIRHAFDDVMTHVPPTEFNPPLTYIMGMRQQKAYKEMETTQLLFIKKLEELKGVVSAINAAAVRTKLLQVASGAVYETEDKYHLLDTSRYELVMDLVEQRKHPLVFFLWRHQKEELIREATARKLKFCVMDGKATQQQRADMVREYQAGFYDLMLAHPETAAHGLTLTRGTSIIWPSPTDNLEWWAQGNKRQRRGEQTELTEVIVILAQNTVEGRVYENLQKKQARMDNLLDLFSE
jgi:SNF2 family DNA or RNA helicase